MNRKSFISLCQKGAVCLILSAPAGLQAVSLDEVLQDVVATNPRILEKQKAYNAALAEQKDARSLYFPKVIFSGDVGYKYHREDKDWDEEEKEHLEEIDYDNETDDGFYDARLTISQLLYDWGRTSSLKSARKNYMLAALYSYLGEANQVAYETIAAYLHVLKYNELRELAMENVLTHENLLESVKLQVERGRKGRSDLERVNGRLASARSRLLLRRNDYKKAVYTLHKMLGRFVVADDMTMPEMGTDGLPQSLKEALDLQVKFNPLLREAYYNTAQKRSEHRNKRADIWGRLSLEGSAGVENEFDSEDDYRADASVSVHYQHTLFDAGRPHRVQAAVSQVHREQQKSYQIRRTLLRDIQLSWSAHKILADQIGILKKNLYFTGKSLESYKKEFVLGRRSLINILDIQNEYRHISEQLIDTVYSREIEKYRILLSEGILLSELGLLNPLAQTMIEKDSGYVPFSNDELPLEPDFDQDQVMDDIDVSMNSLAGEQVNELGISSKYDSSYIYRQAGPESGASEVVISAGDSLKKKPLQVNVDTRFDFDVFLPKSAGLSSDMTSRFMKELVHQARDYSTEFPLYLTVSTNEYDKEDDNYALAIKRAYTLKRILQQNRIGNGIFVFADTNAARGHNVLRLKFTDKTSDYKSQYLSHAVAGKVFAHGKARIKDSKKLAGVITAIRQHQGRAEIILYSNELPDKNQQLGLERAALMTDYLSEKGLGPDKVSVFYWGSFEEDPVLPESKRVNQFMQYVLRGEGL